MKLKHLLPIVLVLAVAMFAFAQSTASSTTSTTKKTTTTTKSGTAVGKTRTATRKTGTTSMGTATFWDKEKGDWMDVPVFPKGAQMKVMYGDPSKGPSDLYVKLPAHYDTTFHWHTPVETVYVDAGQLEFSMPKTEGTTTVGAGGFFRSPSKMVHRAVCASTEDCYFFLHSPAPFDIHLVGEDGKARKGS